MVETFDFIVIGGGICGLQIGALLSRHGKVLLLEGHESLGGRAIVHDFHGFRLDFGPHPVRFGPKSSLAQTMREIGHPVQFTNPGLMYTYLANGDHQIFPSGIKGILKSKMISKLHLLQFLTRGKKQLSQNRRKMLETSLQQYYQQESLNPALFRFLKMASASMQVNPFPERSSIGELLLNFFQVLKKKSVFYPLGGWTNFIEPLASVIRQKGEIHTKSNVTQIIIEHGTAVGVKVGNQIIQGKFIISSIPVQNLFLILDPSCCDPRFVTRCNTLRPTAGICLDFCLKYPITSETLVFFEEIPSLGICSTNLSPNLAPPGKSILSFFSPCDQNIIKDEIARQRYYQEFRRMIIQTYPTLPDAIEYERPLFLSMVDGVEIAIDQHRENRPGIQDTKITNLYLTGDSVGGEGAGGDVGHTSVRECYDLIRKRF
jgi:phytoene dehydrogenase-like protein